MGTGVKLGNPVAMVEVMALGAVVLVVKSRGDAVGTGELVIAGALLLLVLVGTKDKRAEGGALERSEGVAALPSCGDFSKTLELAEVVPPESFKS